MPLDPLSVPFFVRLGSGVRISWGRKGGNSLSGNEVEKAKELPEAGVWEGVPNGILC